MRTLFRTMHLPLLVFMAVTVAGCSSPAEPPSTPASPAAISSAQTEAQSPLAATMNFGIDVIGSPFPPVPPHDQSGHAKDNIVPRTVVIDVGGTVTFKMGPAPVHQVAIYNPGKDPQDVNTAILAPPAATCPQVPLINDPVLRRAVVSTQLCNGGSPAPTYTFTAPGRYLVICSFLPHFNVGMYGWVIVKG